MTDALDSPTPQLAPALEVGDEFCVVDGKATEPTFGHAVNAAEGVNQSDKFVHSTHYSAGYIPWSIASAGFVPKLCGINLGVNHPPMMPGAGIDIELVREVLIEATRGEGSPFSQRSLAKAAGLHADTVRDIINGKNKNPTIAVLAPLADALGKPISVFGLHFVTRAELQAFILEALPEMPARGRERQAEYLTEVVSKLLALP